MATVFDDWGGVVEIAEVVGEKKEVFRSWSLAEGSSGSRPEGYSQSADASRENWVCAKIQ